MIEEVLKLLKLLEENNEMLKENNEMLKEIIALLQYFKDNDDMRQFNINVAADIFAKMLENYKELKDKQL